MTVVSTLSTLVLVYLPSVPATYRTVFTVTNAVVVNSLACHIFRNLRFGLFKDPLTTHADTFSDLRFAHAASVPVSAPAMHREADADADEDPRSTRGGAQAGARTRGEEGKEGAGLHGENTHLDAGEAEDARLLALEPAVDLVRVVAVHVRLGHEREGDAVVELAELRDLLVVLGLLASELSHAGRRAG